MILAFDADVLIDLTVDNPRAAPVRDLFDDLAGQAGIGSLVLVPEVLSKPLRVGSRAESDRIHQLLSRLDLKPVDQAVAQLAAKVGAKHHLKAPDALHLATALVYGADRFVTNNRRDFPKSIPEITIVYPEDLLRGPPPPGEEPAGDNGDSAAPEED